jgi:hypothetical protein
MLLLNSCRSRLEISGDRTRNTLDEGVTNVINKSVDDDRQKVTKLDRITGRVSNKSATYQSISSLNLNL